MASRDLKDFLAHVRDGYNVIPLHETLQLDRETPVSLYQRFSNGRAIFLLESAALAEETGRYSFIGLDRTWRVRTRDGATIVEGTIADTNQGPLETLRGLLGRYRTYLPGELPDFFGGAVGYVAYDYVRRLEHLPKRLHEPVHHVGGGRDLHDCAHGALFHDHRVGIGTADIHSDTEHVLHPLHGKMLAITEG